MNSSSSQKPAHVSTVPLLIITGAIAAGVTLSVVGVGLLVFLKLSPSQNNHDQSLIQADIQKLRLDILNLQDQLNRDIHTEPAFVSSTVTSTSESFLLVNEPSYMEISCTALRGEIRFRSLGIEKEQGHPFCVLQDGTECSENEVLQGYCVAR